jgi:hypothetical protein
MGKIFKGRYFPRGKFLDAFTGYHPSYAWRSILSARDIVQKGAAWVIGNGRRVRIWKDKWVSPQFNSALCNPVRVLHEDATVNELFVADSRVSNKTLIGQNFLPLDALDIVNIPLPSSDIDDILFWPGEKNGEYFVRPAHHFLCNEKIVSQLGPSSPHYDRL